MAQQTFNAQANYSPTGQYTGTNMTGGTPNTFSGTGGFVDAQGTYRPSGSSTMQNQQGQTVPVGTIDASKLNSPSANPFNPPAITPGGTANNALGAAVTPAIPTDQNENNRNDALNALLSTENGYNASAETAGLNSSMGVNSAQSTKDAADADALKTAQYYDNQINSLYNNPNTMDEAGIKGTVENLTRQKNSDLANIAIRQSVATGNLTRLSSIVSLKVKADTEANQNKINSLKDYINALDTDPKAKAQMTAQANAQQAKLDSVKTASADALKTAAQNGAPPEVLDSIGKASSDPNATATSIYQSAGKYMQTKGNVTPFQPVNGTGGQYVPIDTSQITDKNAPQDSLGGMSLNGLTNAAQHWLTTGAMPALGLSAQGNVQKQRMAIINYAGQLADSLGMTQPQIQSMYKANSSAATQIVQRMAKIDTISSAATSQFPRIADLADKVKSDGINITESDIQKGSAYIQSKFGSVDASNYIELLQTIRGDYAGLQGAMGGSTHGGVFFSQKADEAIPAGLSGAQYLGIMETMQLSATNVAQATQEQANKLIGVGSQNPTGEAGGGVPAAPITKGVTGVINGKTYVYNGTGDTSDINNWTAQ